MLHATLIGPGLTVGRGKHGVFKQPGILGCESRSEEGGKEGAAGWRKWRPGVSLLIMDALSDKLS